MITKKQTNSFLNNPDLTEFIGIGKQIALIDFSHHSQIKESLKKELLSRLHSSAPASPELSDHDLDWACGGTKKPLAENPTDK